MSAGRALIVVCLGCGLPAVVACAPDPSEVGGGRLIPPSAIDVRTLDPSEECPGGAARIETGFDFDGDGRLTADEVRQTSTICQANRGRDGRPETRKGEIEGSALKLGSVSRSGIRVELSDGQQVETDVIGGFRFSGLELGIYTLRFSADGYQPRTLGNLSVLPGTMELGEVVLRRGVWLTELETREWTATPETFEGRLFDLLAESEASESFLLDRLGRPAILWRGFSLPPLEVGQTEVLEATFSPDGQVLVWREADALKALDLKLGETTTIDAEATSIDAISPDGRFVVYLVGPASKLYDRQRGQVTTLSSSGPRGAKFFGELLFYRPDATQVVLRDLIAERDLIASPGSRVDLSPDRRFAIRVGHPLPLFDLATGQERALPPFDLPPLFSPRSDGALLQAGGRLFLYHLATGDSVELSNSALREAFPQDFTQPIERHTEYAPDGSALLFAEENTAQVVVHFLAADGAIDPAPESRFLGRRGRFVSGGRAALVEGRPTAMSSPLEYHQFESGETRSFSAPLYRVSSDRRAMVFADFRQGLYAAALSTLPAPISLVKNEDLLCNGFTFAPESQTGPRLLISRPYLAGHTSQRNLVHPARLVLIDLLSESHSIFEGPILEESDQSPCTLHEGKTRVVGSTVIYALGSEALLHGDEPGIYVAPLD